MSTRAARKAFRDLSRTQRLGLLDRVRIISEAPAIDGLDDRLNQRLRFVRPSGSIMYGNGWLSGGTHGAPNT